MTAMKTGILLIFTLLLPGSCYNAASVEEVPGKGCRAPLGQGLRHLHPVIILQYNTNTILHLRVPAIRHSMAIKIVGNV